MKYYKNNSIPLEQVFETDFIDGETYITDEGMRAVYNKQLNELDVIQRSELTLGENVEDLDEKQLKLYWRLMNYRKNNPKSAI